MGYGPVYGGPFRDCGFHGVDDGRYTQESRHGGSDSFEYEPHYTGTVMILDGVTLSTIYVVYEEGVGKKLYFVPDYGPGKSVYETDLPAIPGDISAEFNTDEMGNRLASVTHDGDEVLELNLSELARGAGRSLHGH